MNLICPEILSLATLLPAQVVLAAQGETSTAVHVFRPDHWTAGGATGTRAAIGNASASGGSCDGTAAGHGSTSRSGSGGSEAEERLVLRDWVVGGQVCLHWLLSFPSCREVFGCMHVWRQKACTAGASDCFRSVNPVHPLYPLPRSHIYCRRWRR